MPQPAPATTFLPEAPPAAGRPLVVLAVAFAVGIGCDRFGPPAAAPLCAASWWILALALLAAWWILGKWNRREWLARMGTLLLCASALAAGTAWHHARWHLFTQDEIGRFATAEPEPSCIEAIAMESPRTLPAVPPSAYRAIPLGERSQLEIRLTGIRVGRSWQAARGVARLRVNGQLLGVRAGDRLRVFAEIASPYKPRNPGEFDYALHARAERRLAEFRCGFPECVRIVQTGNWWSPARALDRLQAWCVKELQGSLGPQHGPIAAALVLGVREGISREEMEAYRATGTIHLLVVSGLHVAILAGVAVFLLGLLFASRVSAIVATAFVVVSFASLTGWQPSTARATIGTVAILAALAAGRKVASWNVLGGAALAVLALNPADLFRPGPQLSFLAVATLIAYAQWARRRSRDRPPLDRLRHEARPLPVQVGIFAMQRLWHTLAVSACLWLVALPLVMTQFNLAAPVAAPIAPLVLALSWVGLVSGFALLVAEGLLPFAGSIAGSALGSICGTSIGWLRETVAIAESLPGGHFSVAGPPEWWTVGVYGGLIGAIFAGARLPVRWRLASLSLWIALGLGTSVWRQGEPGTLKCSFLSVGHGTCVVLQTPDGRCFLYDAGSLASPDLAASSIASFLWAEGITRLDGIFLSHADVDHFNAVPGILARFAVSGVFVSPVMFDPVFHPDAASAPRRLEMDLAARKVPVRVIFGGDHLRLGGEVTADVLHPPAAGLIASDNANSIVLAIEYAGRRMLLTGDLEPPGMEDVLAELPYDVDVLLAPHHGSRFSDPPGLAEWCTPESVVISGGDERSSSDAATTYRAAGALVLHTSEQGAVRFAIKRDGIDVDHWAGDAWQALR